MLPGLDHINAAVRILQRESFSDRERVLEAARLFMKTITCCGMWPPQVQGTRLEIERCLVAHGTLDDTIQAATDAELADIAYRILEFAADLYDATSN